jgi:HAD superfamily hydrolase (TIGR01548 family)
MRIDAIVFDMDGVLADVTESYRAAIVETVRHFTGKTVSPAHIQDYKNQGGWNDDWALSRKIAADLGVEVPHDAVVRYFQSIFFNGRDDALILRERWIPEPGLLERLAGRNALAVYTGRPRVETHFTLERFAPGIKFHPVVTADDVTEHKPKPHGLIYAGRLLPGKALCYVGDTVDDARCASAARLPFIGICAPENPREPELRRLLADEGAIAVLESVNQLESVLD